MVIPAYNEAECIESVLNEWEKHLVQLKINHKIFVINDGSTDNTAQILDGLAVDNDNFQIIHQENQGHGQALFHGYQKALDDHPHYVFQTDSDNQFTPEDFRKFWVERGKRPFILGHRVKRSDPFVRKVISYGLSHMIFRYFEVEIEDANCPFRLMESNYLREILTVVSKDAFAPNIFLSILAASEKGCLGQISVQHRERKTGANSILRLSLLKACWKSFKDFFSFKMTLSERQKVLRSIRETDEKLNAA